MNKTTHPKILICYSNPCDTDRLRLDKEHRTIEQVLKNHGLPSSTVHRLHATSVDDLVYELRQHSYEIIQFSGHGSTEGIYLENSENSGTVLLTSEKLASLLKNAAPYLQTLLCISCFSSESIPQLITAASFLVTISGQTEDEDAIEFVKEFFDIYLGGKSVREAFHIAAFMLNFRKATLNAVLTRRATFEKHNRILYEIFPFGNTSKKAIESFCVDITAVESDLSKFSISKEKFLSILTRKIRIHNWIFESPRERALLQLGSYFGVFSWQNAADILYCEKLLIIAEDVDEFLCEAWGKLILRYNESYVAQYRLVSKPSDPSKAELLEKAITNFNSTLKYMFEDDKWANPVRSYVPQQYLASKAFFAANLALCEEKFKQGDYVSTVVYLETMLSSLHDLMDALTEKITVP